LPTLSAGPGDDYGSRTVGGDGGHLVSKRWAGQLLASGILRRTREPAFSRGGQPLMSELIIVAYRDRNRATEVIEVLCQLEAGWIDLNDTIVVVRDRKGRLRIPDQPLIMGRALAWRALWRRLLQTGVSTGGPASGSRKHRSGAAGIPETLLQAAREMVARGDSALIILVRKRLPAHVDEYLSASSVNVLRAPLSTAQDALLYSVLDVQGPVESERDRATHLR
jgi:uncharacterized membrane protein